MAKTITDKVGTKHHRACGKKDVLKTHTYRDMIMPLLRSDPGKPEGWAELLAARKGEDLPVELKELEFDDEELSLEDEDL